MLTIVQAGSQAATTPQTQQQGQATPPAQDIAAPKPKPVIRDWAAI